MKNSTTHLKVSTPQLNPGLQKLDAAAKDFKRALELDNAPVGIHFVKDADIIYYDVEIIFALEKIVTLEEAN